MKKEKSTGERILWVGDKAAETFKKTNRSVLDQFNNNILLYDKRTGDDLRENVTYLKDLIDKKDLEYKPEELRAALTELLENQKIMDADLLIGSSFELLFQELLNIYKPGEKKSQNSSKSKASETLFSYSLYKNSELPSLGKKNLKNVLFLHQDVPFTDMKEESNETMKSAGKHFYNVYATQNSDTDLNEFLFNYSEKDNSLTKDIKTL